MIVMLLLNGLFVVYDEKGVCVNFIIVSGNNKVEFLKNGIIVFVGVLKLEFVILVN